MSGNAHLDGEIEIIMWALLYSTSAPSKWLTHKDIVNRLAKGNEYHAYLLASIFEHSCESEKDEDNIKAYSEAFDKTIEDCYSIDVKYRAIEMIIRLALGNDVRVWYVPNNNS